MEEEMNSSKKTARIVGVLYIIGTVAGILSLVFTGPIRKAQDLLASIPVNEFRLIMAALFVLIMGLALAMIPVMMYSILKIHNKALALGYVVFRGALETITYLASVVSWLLLLPVSQAYGSAGATGVFDFQDLGKVLLEASEIDVISTIVFCLGALMFYYVLYQSKLVPRWISGWGLLAIVPFIAARFFIMFAVIESVSTIDVVLQLPLGVQEMVLAVWLIVKGFNPAAVAAESAKTA